MSQWYGTTSGEATITGSYFCYCRLAKRPSAKRKS